MVIRSQTRPLSLSTLPIVESSFLFGSEESSYQKVAEEKRKIVHQLNVFEVKDFESLQQEKRLEEEIKSIQEKSNLLQKKISN